MASSSWLLFILLLIYHMLHALVQYPLFSSVTLSFTSCLMPTFISYFWFSIRDPFHIFAFWFVSNPPESSFICGVFLFYLSLQITRWLTSTWWLLVHYGSLDVFYSYFPFFLNISRSMMDFKFLDGSIVLYLWMVLCWSIVCVTRWL